jgi:hypothetical protein
MGQFLVKKFKYKKMSIFGPFSFFLPLPISEGVSKNFDMGFQKNNIFG